MITITDGLYLHQSGTTRILSDQKHMPRPIRLQGKIILMADDLPGTKLLFKRWLDSSDLDEAARILSISRTSAHRLRAAMGITKRGSYSK